MSSPPETEKYRYVSFLEYPSTAPLAAADLRLTYLWPLGRFAPVLSPRLQCPHSELQHQSEP